MAVEKAMFSVNPTLAASAELLESTLQRFDDAITRLGRKTIRVRIREKAQQIKTEAVPE